MTPPKARLPFLDSLRGAAALSVFLFHGLGASFGFDRLPWNGLVRNFASSRSFLVLYPFSYGVFGVAVFFVISGFCIHLSHRQSQDKGWRHFASRRFFRIYPAYVVAFGLFFLARPGGFGTAISSRTEQLVTHLAAVHNFSGRTLYGINPSFWSIAVEIQLYALYPLLLLFTAKAGWRPALAIAGCVELLIRGCAASSGVLGTPSLPTFIGLSPFGYWLGWSLGAYLCECFLLNRTSWLFAPRCDVVAAVALAMPLFKPTAPFAFLAFCWLTAIVIQRLIVGRWTLPKHRWFAAGWSHLGLLGVVSYSFYLLHQPIVSLAGRAAGRIAPDLAVSPLFKYAVCLSSYPLVLFLSYVLYRLVEKPSIALGVRVAKRRGASVRQAQPALTGDAPVGQVR